MSEPPSCPIVWHSAAPAQAPDLSPDASPLACRRRNEALSKANALVVEGKAAQARDFYVKAVDVTPQMAYQLIKVGGELDRARLTSSPDAIYRSAAAALPHHRLLLPKTSPTLWRPTKRTLSWRTSRRKALLTASSRKTATSSSSVASKFCSSWTGRAHAQSYDATTLRDARSSASRDGRMQSSDSAATARPLPIR